MNVQVGSGHTFVYANTMSNIGAVNLNSGTLQLPNSGTSAAGGRLNTVSYTQLAGSTLWIEVGATDGAPPVTGTDSVNASGAMALAGNFTAFELGANFRPGTTYTYSDVLTWGSLSGDFSAVTSNSPLFSASVSQSGNSDTLTVSLLPIGSVSGLDPNARSMLAALKSGGSPTLDLVYTLNASQLSSVVTALEGQQHTQDFHFATENWQDFTTILEIGYRRRRQRGRDHDRQLRSRQQLQGCAGDGAHGASVGWESGALRRNAPSLGRLGSRLWPLCERALDRGLRTL